MKLGVTLDILNQKGTPAFNADTLANRPAPGYVGRVFISTDTYDLYRDTGTTWVLLSPSSTGTITGSGTTNTLPLWTSASAIGNSALVQNTGVSISIGSVGTPYDFIGYGNNYAAKFVKNGASATDILAGDGSSITAGSGISISGGQISATGGGGVTGSGSVGQVSYWSGASSITGTNNLFWDSANNRLGVNTNAPTSSFDVHSAASTNVISQLNQLSAGFDSLLAFQDNSIGKWRIGSYYNTGNFSFGIYDVLYSQERFSIQNGGTTFVGPQTSTSGLFNINSANGDNHLVVIGASAPSMRVRNAGTAATYQFGLGLATTTNNFIQGTIGGEFCLFNDSSVNSPILFGIKDSGSGLTNEVARFSSSSNLLIGKTTDSGQKLQVSGMLNSGVSYRAGTYTSGDTTPSVSGVSFLNISNSVSTTITNFTGGIENQVISLYFNDSNTTINRSNAYLSLGLNFTSTAYDMLTLIYISGNWYEISRSINS